MEYAKAEPEERRGRAQTLLQMVSTWPDISSRSDDNSLRLQRAYVHGQLQSANSA